MSGEGADCPPPEIYAAPDRSTAAGGRASEASIAAAPAGRPTPITQSVEELLEQRSVSGVAEVIPILRFCSPILQYLLILHIARRGGQRPDFRTLISGARQNSGHCRLVGL